MDLPFRTHRQWRTLAGSAAFLAASLGVCGQAAAPPQMRAVSAGVVRDWKASDQYFCGTYGPAEGLPQINVSSTLQTPDGYLWVGTGGGIARFDGNRFVVFRRSNTPALVNPLVLCLFYDRERNLWAGTERGAVRYHAGAFERIGPEDASVVAIAQDGDGRIWLATAEKGLFVYEHGMLKPDGAGPALHNGRMGTVFADSAGRLWIGTADSVGLWLYDRGVLHRAPAPIDRSVYAIGEWPRGTLWIGTSDRGLYRLRDGRLAHTLVAGDPHAQPRIVSLVPDPEGGLWVASTMAIQHIADAQTMQLKTIAGLPPETYIASLSEDRERSLWIGTNTNGLIQARRIAFRTISAEQHLPVAVVKTVAEDRSGNVWLATKYAGIMRIAPDGAVTEYIPNVAPQEPTTVYATRDGSVWAGNRFAWRWRGGSWEFLPDISNVREFFEDREGTLWIASTSSAAGLLRYRDGKLSPVALRPDDSRLLISSACEGPDGTMYFGSWNAGLFEWKNGRARSFDRTNGLPSNRVRAMYVDRDNRLWVGMRSAGLALRIGDRWWNPNALSETLGEDVTAIAEDAKGRLWLGTANGVMWTEKRDLIAAALGRRPLPEIHEAAIPEQGHLAPIWWGPQPTVWPTADGQLLFATARGLISVDPQHVALNPVPPRVHVESVDLDGRIFANPRQVKVPPGTRQLAIEYTAVSFLQPERMRFRYQLRGYDAAWVEAGPRRTAYYSRLPAGRYEFRVEACNSDGVWNTTGDTVRVQWQPYFYQTMWFAALAILAAIGAAVGAHRWHIAALRRKNQRLEQRVEERTRELALANAVVTQRTRELELANTAKSEFLEQVSHEIRNPLHGLNGLLGLLRRQNLPAEVKSLTQSLQGCAQTLTRVFDQVLSFNRLEYGTLELREAPFSLRSLLGEVRDAHDWRAGQRGNRIAVEVAPDTPDRFLGDSEKIKTIVGNFLSNAIKYAPGSPLELKAEAYPAEDGRSDVHIEVCDHGPGIPAAEQELIFNKFVRGSNSARNGVPGTGLGLAICRVLARALGGNVGVESEAGSGATFYLRVPLRRSVAVEAPAAPEPAPCPPAALVVEDERYNQVVLVEMLRELGFAPEAAGSAEEAAALLEANRYALILVDWELPGGKGDAVARRARAQLGGGEPIIIATTAQDGEAIRARCRQAGMDDFLPKPCDAEQLRARVAEIRARRKGGTPDPARDHPESAPRDSWNALRMYARSESAAVDDAGRRYAAALDQELEQLRAAVAHGDLQAAAACAHRIRALGGLVGDEPLAEAARALEWLPAGAPAADLRAHEEAVVAAAASLKRRVEAALAPT